MPGIAVQNAALGEQKQRHPHCSKLLADGDRHCEVVHSAKERDSAGRGHTSPKTAQKREMRSSCSEPSVHPAETVVQRIAGAANGADRVGHVATIDRLAQTSDMHVDSALIDIDVRSPDPVEQLLA